MHKTISLVTALSLTLLVACNSSDKPLEVTQRETTEVSTEAALRNMAIDSGNSIESPDAVNVPDAEQVGNLIDGDLGSKFLSFAPNATVIFSATKPYILKSYNLVSANDEPQRDPVKWVLEGSADKELWIQIESQSEQSFAGRTVKNEYQLDFNETAYQHYRFSFTHTGVDTYGNNILQLAELELMVKADKPIVSFKTDKPRVEVGEEVAFLDQSLANPTSWSWTFEGGTPATSTQQHPVVKFSSIGPKNVTLVATNDKGSNTLTKEHVIWVWDAESPWAGFPQPEVSFNKIDPEHQAQKELERIMPDLEQVIHQVSLGVAKILYNDVTEINIFKTLSFETGHYDYPAAKSGTDTDMILQMDLDHIANILNQGDQALRNEVIGMLWHELTHGYSNSPNTGQYATGDEYHTFLESVADYVRIKAGYNEHKRNGVKWVNSWNEDAYNQTSFFLEWVQNSHRSIDFIKLFNRAAGELPAWSFDAAFKSILGEDRGIETLWNEYQVEYLQKVLGIYPPYPTPVEGFKNFAVDEGVIISTNATDIGIWNEGVDKLIDNNVTLKFNAVIETPWWIPEYAPSLLPINEVTNVEVLIEVTEETILNIYSISTGNDNPQRDPTSWTVSGSNNGETWTQLDSAQYPETPARLTTYHFNIENNTSPYRFYQFIFENAQEGDGIGGDDGRLVQIGEIALLTEE
ncbi:basic secretory protein-like protein [Aliikangiella sp. IMCC44359]|uniref:basic secretory protein-like protein n=1 Tax=Aliikangiella sp. IMCC44359 TaxID=3459125 RepID=UPI00403ABDE1